LSTGSGRNHVRPNAGDKEATFAVLTPDATTADDGNERDPGDWIEREIFSSNGHLAVAARSE
jgi:hypothetical protein